MSFPGKDEGRQQEAGLTTMALTLETGTGLPAWVPDPVRLYLRHTEEGLSLRAIAREAGLNASTVLRHVRRCESLRDDPLIDEALSALGTVRHSPRPQIEERHDMTMPLRTAGLPDEVLIAKEARRILRRLCEAGAVLALAAEMDKAAVLKTFPDGRSARTAVVDRAVAQAFALKDWIACRSQGRLALYAITPAGRSALKRLLAEDEAARQGMAEAPAVFGEQHRVWGERVLAAGDEPKRLRCNLAESPVAMLGRRREKDGQPFLSADLVAAAERLREDFELAQMGPRVAQNWDRFLTAGDRTGYRPGTGPAEGPSGARDRVAAALRDLGPGLGDMVLRCCCYLEGLEAAERRMGWSARSGKIVLRIALQRLRRHYDELGGAPLIG